MYGEISIRSVALQREVYEFSQMRAKDQPCMLDITCDHLQGPVWTARYCYTPGRMVNSFLKTDE